MFLEFFSVAMIDIDAYDLHFLSLAQRFK
jgi:hypothetical protein